MAFHERPYFSLPSWNIAGRLLFASKALRASVTSGALSAPSIAYGGVGDTYQATNINAIIP